MKENFRGFDKKPAKSAKINTLKAEKSVREHEILFALRKIFDFVKTSISVRETLPWKSELSILYTKLVLLELKTLRKKNAKSQVKKRLRILKERFLNPFEANVLFLHTTYQKTFNCLMCSGGYRKETLAWNRSKYTIRELFPNLSFKKIKKQTASKY